MASTTAQVANAIIQGINTGPLFRQTGCLGLNTAYINNASNVALANSIATMVSDSPFFAQLNTSWTANATITASADLIATAVKTMFANSEHFAKFSNAAIVALGD